VSCQVYPRREQVVVDGASTDCTAALLRQQSHQWVRWVSDPNSSPYDALNKGLRVSTGSIVGFLHADAVLGSPHALMHVAEAFMADPNLSAVFGDLQYVRKDDLTHVVRHWRATPFTRNRLAWGWMPPHPTLYVRRSWYPEFDTNLAKCLIYLEATSQRATTARPFEH
jgi:glycosyltransferase involved in cell wall biosynthesis